MHSSGRRLNNSNKHLQPPTLSNSASGLYNSENTYGDQIRQIHELSNVEQKSYNSSQNNQHEHHEIKEILDRISPYKQGKQQSQQQGLQPSQPSNFVPSSPRRSTTPRLEQQQIIAVEEQFELDSDAGNNNQSVILEHIDFQDNQLNAEQKRNLSWKEVDESGKEAYESEQVDYVINFMEPQEFGWERGEDNESGTSPQDLMFDQMKVVCSRQSKNTYRERLNDHKIMSVNNENKNKSCLVRRLIRRQSSGQSQPILSPNSQTSRNSLNQILNKWKNYRQSHNQEQHQVEQEHEPERDMNNYESIGYKTIKQFQNSVEKYNAEVQTMERFQNYDSLMKNLEFTQDQWRKCQSQNIKLIQKQNKSEAEMIELNYMMKDMEKQNQKQEKTINQNKEKERKLIQNIQELSQKNMQLEMCVRDQNQTIRTYQEKNLILSKQLQKTIRLNSSVKEINNHANTFLAPKMHKMESFGISGQSSVDHQECVQKIETLQEQIFDLEQKSVSIDLQVDRKVKSIYEQLQFDLRRNIALEYQQTIRVLQQELRTIEDRYNMLESERRNMSESLRYREKQLTERQEKVKSMYDELVSEWREVQKTRQRYRQSNVNPYNSYLPHKSSPRSFREPYQPNLETSLVRRQYNYRQNDNYKSIKDLNLPSSSSNMYRSSSNKGDLLSAMDQFNYTHSRAQSTSYKFIPEPAASNDKIRPSLQKQSFFRKTPQSQPQSNENMELYTINTKIHKLREQINRQLNYIN